MRISVHGDATKLGARLAYSTVSGVSVRREVEGLREYASNLIDELRAKYTLESLKDQPVVRAYRDFFWRIDIDPTKTRPSAEALLRRVLGGREIPTINNVVDAGNLASLETLVPIGLYDLDRLEGSVALRTARPGEIFRPIGGREMTMLGSEPVLADSKRIIHLFPHRDSDETKIGPSTRRVLVVACGVPRVTKEALTRAARLAAELIARFAGGTAEGEILVTP